MVVIEIDSVEVPVEPYAGGTTALVVHEVADEDVVRDVELADDMVESYDAGVVALVVAGWYGIGELIEDDLEIWVELEDDEVRLGEVETPEVVLE